MIVEVISTIGFASLAGYSYVKSNGNSPVKNDSDKIIKIFNNSGMMVKGETIRIIRKEEIEGGMLYVFQLPLGLGSDEIIAKKKVLEDGLNTRSRHVEISFKDIKNLRHLKFDKTIIKQFKKIFTQSRLINKEIDIEFDGMLKLKVYDSPLPNKIDLSDDMLKPGTWSVPIGSNRDGMLYHDFDKRKHLIIAGSTGFGKSVIMKTIITSLILSKPDDVSFSLIDLKGGPAFARFKDAKQVKRFGTDNKEAETILLEVQKDMERDYKRIVNGGYEDVSEANIKGRHFLIIDEGADLAGGKKSADKTGPMDILTDIVRKGRGAGYYVIFATQYPTAETIPMQVKRNIPARLCYILDSATASLAVLDSGGAESLPEIPGRGIYKEVKKITVQSPYMSNKQIEERIAPHVNIQPRKDDEHEQQQPEETNEDGKYSIVIE